MATEDVTMQTARTWLISITVKPANSLEVHLLRILVYSQTLLVLNFILCSWCFMNSTHSNSNNRINIFIPSCILEFSIT